MLDHVFRRPSRRDRVLANPLGNWLPDYIAYLVARGHPPSLIQEYVRSVEHFGSWLASEHLAPEERSPGPLSARSSAIIYPPAVVLARRRPPSGMSAPP